MSRFATRRRMLAMLLLALWWGGFSFYAGRVVFIGHEVLSSKVRQGFITERVTNEFNCLAVVALALVGWELAATQWSSRTRRGVWFAWGTAVAATVALFFLHAKLGSLLDFSARQVADDLRFYDWHRTYLWTATVQWFAGTTVLVALLSTTNSAPASNHDSAG